MNQTQVKYARGRATAIYQRRKETLEATFTTPAVSLTAEEKLAIIATGKGYKVNLKADLRFGWDRGVTFTAEKPKKFDKKGHEVALAKLAGEFETLIDELVLGDNEAALALLKAFEAAA